jgi:hypothetical protein
MFRKLGLFKLQKKMMKTLIGRQLCHSLSVADQIRAVRFVKLISLPEITTFV